MDLVGEIEKNRLDDCYSVIRQATSLRGKPLDIFRVSIQSGGLFNYLLRIETNHATLFFKQYLDGVANEIYNLPDIPAASRSRLAYEVQHIAFHASKEIPCGAVPEIIVYDAARNALLMHGADGDVPLIDLLSTGVLNPLLSTALPAILARLHQTTYGVYGIESLYANREFRNFKLELQYDDIAERLNPEEARRVLACRKLYVGQARCVTHGDINSRNIIVDDHCLSIIDFEQSHLGTPAYDLAYILCEIYISMAVAGEEARFSGFLNGFLDTYFANFDREARAQIDEELTCHFAVQVIYRFWGPSHRSWTFYVDDAVGNRVVNLARRMLVADKPLSQVVQGAALH